MNRRQLAPGIFIYSQVLDSHTEMIKDIEEGAESSQTLWVQSEIIQGEDSRVDKDYRDTYSITIGYSPIVLDQFSNLKESFNSSLSNIFLAGFSSAELDYKIEHNLETTWHESYSILKYGKGQKFVNHVDDHKDYHRRVSVVYYMNDNYSGGEIVFPRFGITYKPLSDELLIFPSTYVYNHSVSPVVEGTRYSVVSWLK